MRLGAITTSYRDQETIRGTLSCLKPFVDQHIVLLSEKPYYQDYSNPDGTEEICKEVGVDVVKGVWKEEHLQRNLGVSLLKDCAWILWFDADEMMIKEDLAKFIKYLETVKEDAVAIISKVYWKNTQYRFDPHPDHHKIIATRPNVTYYDRACFRGTYKLLENDNELGITHHHLSYCAPKDILNKVLHYSHANEFDGKKWYEEHFVNWQPGQPVYQPFGTKWEAVYDPLPEELEALLK